MEPTAEKPNGQAQSTDGLEHPATEPVAKWSETWRRAESKAAIAEARAAKEVKREGRLAAEALRAQTAQTADAAAEPGSAEPDVAEKSAAAEVTETGPSDPEHAAEDSAGAGDKVAQLHALAKELGLVVKDGRVTPDDRAQFRAEKRKFAERVKAERAEFVRKLQAAEQYYAPLAEVEAAWKAGDYDGALRKLGQRLGDDDVVTEGLSAVNKRHLRREANKDPRIDEMERELRAARQEKAAWAEQQRRVAEAQAQQAARAQWVRGIHSELAAAEEPAVKALADNPAFLTQVFERQQAEWDGEETLSATDAARAVLKELRSSYDMLHNVFGDRVASNPESLEEAPDAGRTSKTSVRQKTQPKTLSARNATEASPRRQLSDKEWLAKWSARLKESSAE